MLTYLVSLARWTLLLVFAGALFGKLRNRAAWADFVVATERLLGVRRRGALWAVGGVLIEAGTVACLLVDTTARIGLLLALVALAVFSVVIVHALERGVDTSCNCFGSDGAPLSWRHVTRNATLVVLAGMGTGAAASLHEVHSVLPDVTYATSAVLSIVVSAIFVLWDDFLYLVAGSQN
jgi:hypothetical protein